MKVLHGSVRTEVKVKVDGENIDHDEYLPDHGFFAKHGDATFSVDPDGALHIYGDPSKPAHHSYGRNCWLWVGDENNTSVFNTAHDEHRPE